MLVGGHSGCQIQLFWGGDRGGNGGGVVTGSTGGYWWLWSGYRQWVPCKSEGGRERRGKAGGAEERPVGTETEELDYEDSVGPWPLFPRRKREIRGGSEKRRTEWAVTRGECKSLFSGEATTRPSAAGARWSEDIILRRADSVARRMRQRSTCGFGARPSRRRDGGPDSKRVSGSWWRRPSGLRSYSELFWGAWIEAQQKLHLQDNIFLFGAGSICSSCNAWSFFVYIYVLHINFTAYATFYHSEHCLWINLVHSMHLTEFTTNPTTTDCTRVFPKVTLQKLILWDKDLHLSVVYLQASSLHCSFTRVKTLNHFFHRHWRLRQYLSYICSCNNWYMNGKFFTTEWKQEIKVSFRKMSKLNFHLYFDLCRSVEFTLVSSISILH